jgi:hypothetical protein
MGRLIKIDENMILKVLSKGLGYQLTELPVVGSVISMPAREAFVYSVITSHGYLDDKEPDNLYRVTRDAFRIFNQACRFEFQEGIFSLSDMRLASTVNNEVIRKPYISRGNKFILPIRYATYRQFQLLLKQISKKLLSKGFNVNDFIICPIKVGSTPNVELESFFEFVVSRYFRNLGYLTDTQIPFFYGIGTPDIAAYAIPDFMKALRQYGYLSLGGSLIDLMTVSTFGRFAQDSNGPTNNEAIVCEVKTAQITAPQIIKYINTKIFNKAYEVIPCIKEPESYAGLITVDSAGQLIVFESKEPLQFSQKKQKEYLSWVEYYAKFYLLANLYTNELEMLLMKNGLKLNRNDILAFVKRNSVEKMLAHIEFFLARRGKNVQN